MSPRAAPDGVARAGWFTPPRLLALFCAMSTLIYLDRGVISSAAVSGTPGTPELAGSGLQGDFRVGYYAYGLLQAAFMFGLLLGCPVFSALAKTANPFRLIAVGLGAWTVAVLGCAAAPNYASLFVSRALVGVGEASFVSLAAPFIDDYAPKERKTSWLAAFYMCVPVGVAAGFAFGGAVGGTLGWRWAFAFEAAAMAPVVAVCLASPPIPMRGVDGGADTGAVDRSGGADVMGADHRGADETGVPVDENENPHHPDSPTPNDPRRLVREFARDATALLRRPTFALVVLGYVFYTAVIGVYAVWGPKAGYAVFADSLHSPARSDVVFGGVTVAAGATGTILGGAAVDFAGASVAGAARACAVATLLAFALLECAFAAASFPAFVALFTAGETLAFVAQAPVNAIVLWSVPAGARPLACSLTTVFIHLLGDVPTPPLFGAALQSAARARGGDGAAPAPEDWRRILAGFTVAMLAAAATFAATAAAAAAEATAGESRDEGNRRAREEAEASRPLLREEGEGGEDV